MNNETLLNLGGRLKIAPKHILLLKAEINYTKVHLDISNPKIKDQTWPDLSW